MELHRLEEKQCKLLLGVFSLLHFASLVFCGKIPKSEKEERAICKKSKVDFKMGERGQKEVGMKPLKGEENVNQTCILDSFELL